MYKPSKGFGLFHGNQIFFKKRNDCHVVELKTNDIKHCEHLKVNAITQSCEFRDVTNPSQYNNFLSSLHMSVSQRQLQGSFLVKSFLS